MTVPGITGRRDLYQGALTGDHWWQYLVNQGLVYKEQISASAIVDTNLLVVPILTPDTTTKVWLKFCVSVSLGAYVSFWEGTAYAPVNHLINKNRIVGGNSTTHIENYSGETTEPAVGTKLWEVLLEPTAKATYLGYAPQVLSNVLDESNYLLARNTEYSICVKGIDVAINAYAVIDIEIVEEVPRE